MSYAVTRPPADQTTTSTIHEFICLFTHDLKRKTKRWQDGRLKYHLFNNRIMVYDDRGGNVGDAHWTANMSSSGSEYLEEGDEFDLDRGAAIVQVCERVGCKEVDLRELVDKRAREVEKRRVEAAGRSTQGNRGVSAPNAGGNRALSSMVTPGRIGRAAVPRESPFEQRMRREQQQDGPPPAKRAKREPSPPSKSTHARALFGTQLTLSTPGGSGSWGRSQVLRDRTNVRAQVSSSLEEGDEAGKENERGGKGVRDVTPDEEVTERRSTVVGTASRLGGLRIERPKVGAASHPLDEGGDPSDRESSPALERPKAASRPQQAESRLQESTKKPLAPPASSPLFVEEDDDQPPRGSQLAPNKSSTKLPNVSRLRKAEPNVRATMKQPVATLAPRASSPQDLTMDDDPLPHESPPAAGKSKPGKPAVASRPDKISSKRHRPVHEELEHGGPRGKQASTPSPASSSRSNPHHDLPAEKAAAGMADQRGEKRTELRIKKGKKRGLLMLAQPPPSIEVQKKPPSPEPEKKDEGVDAGFMAWLDDDDDLEPDVEQGSLLTEGEGIEVTQRAQHRKENSRDPEPDADAQLTDDGLESADLRVDDQRCEVAMKDRHDASPPTRPSPPQTRQIPTEKGHSVVSLKNDTKGAPNPLSTSPEAKSPANELQGSETNDSPPPRALRSKKRIAKSAITIPTSPAAPAPDPEPTYMHSSASESDSEPEPEPTPGTRTRSSRSKQPPINKSGTRKQSSAATADSTLRSKKDPGNAEKKRGSESGITVSRISRSCKSKVITGYVERDPSAAPSTGNYLLPGDWGSATAVLAAEEKLSDEAGADGEKQTPVPDEGRVTAERKEGEEANTVKTRQISNPATRGRKAASKADAAGGILQVTVPFDEPVPRPRIAFQASTRGRGAIISGGEASSSTSSTVVITSGKLGGHEKKDLPGFAKANGGAWSRHAGDLLGMGRPEGKPRR